MYPFLRMAKEVIIHRNKPPLPITGSHVSHHICWPWDLDLWMEMNNGRTLTLYDLGRIPLIQRMGLVKLFRETGWGLTIAGSSVRYRRRVRMFQKVEMRSRCIGWDHRFIYLVQDMWRDGDCTSQALYRAAATDKNGIVTPDRVLKTMGLEAESPPLPDWVQAWINAEDSRPWPPERV